MLIELQRYDEAEAILRKILESAEQIDSSSRAAAAEIVAKALKGQVANPSVSQAVVEQKLKEGLNLLENVVRYRKQFMGQTHPATAGALRNLAEMQLAGALRSNGGGSSDVTIERALATAEAALQLAESAHKAALYALEQRKAALLDKNEKGPNEDDQGWWSRVWPSKASKKTIKDLALLKFVRPEVSALELASCLRTVAEVQRVAGNVESAKAPLQRGVTVLSSDWPRGVTLKEGGAYTTAYNRLEQLRKDGLCKGLREWLAVAIETSGKQSGDVKDVQRRLKEENCC